jgi:HK97 family phage major capsid protein
MLPASTVGRTVAKIYEQSSMRRICSVQTISGNDIEGMVDNDEADAGWVSELGTRSETGTPQVGKWRIEAFEMYAMPKISQRILDDAATDLEGWLANKIADKFARTEGDAFINGIGAGKPRGLFTYTTAATADSSRAWGQFEHVKTGANGDFHTTKADPIQDLIGAFKDQYLQNASFLTRREVRTKIRKMKEATSDRYLWEPSLQMGQPDRLLGYPVVIDQYVPTLGTGSLSLAFGDFKEAFLIVDRLGIRTLRDPYTAKPYITYYSTKRVGSGALNYEAVKFLSFAS